MRLGFNWELGPFELWDAAGVEATVARMKKEGKPVAANVEKLAGRGPKILVRRRSEISFWPQVLGTGHREAGNRFKFPPASGRSQSRRNPTAW